MNLSEELTIAMSPHGLFGFKIFGMEIFVTDTIFLMWIIMAIMIILAMLLTRNLKLVPDGKQNAAEAFVEFMQKFSKDNMGHHSKHFVPYLGTLVLFLAVSNTISIFNILPVGSLMKTITGNEAFGELVLRPPTKDINLTVILALISIILVIFSSIRFKGVKGWLQYHVEPSVILLPFKIMDYFVRTLSLSMRLFGNILGSFILMELVFAVMPAFVPAVFSIYFDLFDGFLQAYVFVFLTSLYIGEAIE
ncbi:MAG: F0F1 ATP synthase subunit A [Eubacteriaceae bacterium]|nr:F0F1 ATP synthase subunit A [Eubacteriaceae bacterium]